MDGGSLEKERYYHNQGATITTRTLLSQPEGDYYNPGCDSSVLSGCANCVLVVLVNYQLCYKYLSLGPGPSWALGTFSYIGYVSTAVIDRLQA